MLFSDAIPTTLKGDCTTKFVSVLDGLLNYKRMEVFSAMRVYNPVLNNNQKWLRKQLSEYGFSSFPEHFPVRILQQILLNAVYFMQLRGSKLGLEFFLSVSSLGNAIVDDNSFSGESYLLFPDHPTSGMITQRTTDKHKYLADNNKIDESQESDLSIRIFSKYFSGEYPLESEAIKEYISSEFGNYIGFSGRKDYDIEYIGAPKFYYHGLLNRNFINTPTDDSDFELLPQ